MVSGKKIVLACCITALLSPLALYAQGTGYKVLAWNNLGMHCMDSDFSVFSILPPYNTVDAHVITPTGALVTTAGSVLLTYEGIADPGGSINTTSRGKSNFWLWAADLYGASLAADMGFAGNAMPGAANVPQPVSFDPAFRLFEAAGIPITPIDDAMARNTYPLMRITARDTGGALLASADTVLPVSDEMDCRACHASGGSPSAEPFDGWVNDANPERDYRLNILRLHNDYEGSNSDYTAALATAGYSSAGLYENVVTDGRPILCARCHASEALPGTGIAGIPPLTTAVHGLHESARDPVTGEPLGSATNRDACYRCHPGSVTRCLRGPMGNASPPMQCQDCHGPMGDVGSPARTGWLDEPTCQSCHTGTAVHNNGQIRYTSVFASPGVRRTAVDATFATKPDTPAAGFSLYRFSTGHGGLRCEACHGSTHAEYPSSEPNDSIQAIALQGHDGMLIECDACHGAQPVTVTGGPHGLHELGQGWVDRHGGIVQASGATQCRACHGVDLLGTVLSSTKTARSFDADGSPVSFPRKHLVSCFDCHGQEWPDFNDVLRNTYRIPLSGAFPLPPYDVLPPAAPYVDPQPVLTDGLLYYYQIVPVPVIRADKSAPGSVALWY